MSDSSLRETRWWRLLRRILWAKRRGFQVRVQAKIGGEWRYLGQR